MAALTRRSFLQTSVAVAGAAAATQAVRASASATSSDDDDNTGSSNSSASTSSTTQAPSPDSADIELIAYVDGSSVTVLVDERAVTKKDADLARRLARLAKDH